jgi:hypothetical protein
MGNVFEDACDASSRSVDETFGERWTYRPMHGDDPNGRFSPDPDRPVREITGAFIDLYARAFSGPARRQGVKPEQPGHASDRPILDLDLRQLPYRPRSGDRAARHKTRQMFKIAEVRPDGTGRAELDLNLLSARTL